MVLSVPLAALWVGTATAAGEGAQAGAGTGIKDLLARNVKDIVCFRGSFTGHGINVRDYLKAKSVPAPDLSQDGKQVMRTVPAIYVGQDVRSLTVLVEREDGVSENWDEMHGFSLKVSMRGWRGPLYTEGSCSWRGSDKLVKGTSEVAEANTSTLSCHVDCEGGGMEMRRVPGSRDVIFHFHNTDEGLRMSGSPKDEGSYYLGGSGKPLEEAAPGEEKHPVEFRLSPMPAKQCEAFRKETGRSAD